MDLAKMNGKPLVWLKGEVKTPPFSQLAKIEAGYLQVGRLVVFLIFWN